MSVKSIVIWLIIIALVAAGVYYFVSGSSDMPKTNYQSLDNSYQAPNNPPTPTNTEPKSTDTSTSVPTATNKVEISANGFSPSAIKVKVGDTVTWTNMDSVPHWPATAAHPTHLVYPGSDIKKCGTPEQSSIFDACKGLATGESYSLKFDQKGDWKYHDHLKAVAPFFGSVTVE